MFDFFDQYEWHLDTRGSATGRDINPDVIGYIFEKYINDRASMGAYYTKEDITEYIGKNTIIPSLFDVVKKKVANAFHKDSSLWKLLRDNPDRYIYPAVRHGVYEGLPDNYSSLTLNEKVCTGLPENIAIGVNTNEPNLLERRKDWNTKAPKNIALPTEIFRELIERRKRYWELRKKIENCEITEINDFITYNLDIRQFAQDAVQEYEGSDFTNAFYKALNKISILDPTCGSGAFLFAALNILEPLYEGCLERMQQFVTEDDQKDGKKFGQFRKILSEINVHPSRQYYIFKSIIMNNLYGVDIMHEAVEIAKLRLFLKLTASVDVDYSKENLGLEPLPDLDFNLRAGNTLVGFAKLDDVGNAIPEMIKQFDEHFLDKIKEQAEYVKMAYRAFRIASVENDASLKDAKKTLTEKLKKLNDELDIYQAHLYGVDAKNKPVQFAAWKKSHQPFHWFAEFYDIVHDRGGFDVIIGNPPYVEYSKIKKSYSILNSFKTLSCNNLYAFVFEQSSSLCKIYGRLGLIVPISIVCTKRMKPILDIISQNSYSWQSCYAERPSKLFQGAEVLLTISILLNDVKTNTKKFITGFRKWHSDIRQYLFQLTNYNISEFQIRDYLLPKIENSVESKIISKFFSGCSTLGSILSGSSNNNKIFYRIGGGRYWKIFSNFQPRFILNGSESVSSRENYLYFNSQDKRDIVISFLSSSLFYWYFMITTNGRDLNPFDLNQFPINYDNISVENKSKLLTLTQNLMTDYKENKLLKHKISKKTGEIDYEEFYPRISKSIIDNIDKELSKHFGFTEEELDFIINYDIKYRMGNALYNGD